MPLTAPQHFRCAVIPLACAKRAVSSHAMLACHNVRAVESIVASTQELLVTGRATGEVTFCEVATDTMRLHAFSLLGCRAARQADEVALCLVPKTNSDQ